MTDGKNSSVQTIVLRVFNLAIITAALLLAGLAIWYFLRRTTTAKVLN